MSFDIQGSGPGLCKAPRDTFIVLTLYKYNVIELLDIKVLCFLSESNVLSGEGLHLLTRLALFDETDLHAVNGLPNANNSSDHLPLLACFRLHNLQTAATWNNLIANKYEITECHLNKLKLPIQITLRITSKDLCKYSNQCELIVII